ncbi:hypothetical protein BSL78_13562 [Apostichopus japonicus]|uniref:Peptidase aspartic putative domain-containing protein n=1 Tax=Stichopus japonicus TaxID=307972 RepID=A0A2G8KNF6_STIJA|nr:hypothetical protein BSL78_13562 [Apostichopus japonicus]
MTEFVEEQAKISSNVYGKQVGKSQKLLKSGTPPRKYKETRATFATYEGTSDWPKRKVCQLCKGEHDLEECQDFTQKPLVERLTVVKQRGLCFNCLKKNHTARACRSSARCGKADCNWKHNTLLHSERRMNSDSSQPASGQQSGAGLPQERPHEAVVNSNQVKCNNLTSKKRVSLRVLQVRVRYHDREMKTWALLDDGSDVSLFEQSLADDLGINEKMKPFSLTTVNSPGVHRKGMEANIMVKAITEGEEIEISKAWTVDRLPVSDRSIPQKEDINTWPHLKGIALHTANKADIKLLIGCDTPEAFWVLEERARAKERAIRYKNTPRMDAYGTHIKEKRRTVPSEQHSDGRNTPLTGTALLGT